MLTHFRNVVVDTDYTTIIPDGGFPRFDHLTTSSTISSSPSWFDKLFGSIFGTPKKTPSALDPATSPKASQIFTISQNSPLKDQIKKLLAIPDGEYSDKMLNSDLRKYITNVEHEYLTAMSTYKSHIAPSYREVKPTMFNISGMFGKTYYAHSYPSYIDFLWTRDVLGFYSKWDMSFYIYPSDDGAIQSMMKRRATQLKAEINDALSKGITMDTNVEAEYNDVEMIRQKLTTKEERYFEVGYYINLYNSDSQKLVEDGKRFEQKIGGFGIGIKSATQRMDEGLESAMPLMIDDLGIYRSSVTTSLAGSFPFISSDLIDNGGILYGVNLHTGGLVIYDRFNKKSPNANSVVLATSGAGKSFAVKLEILRYLLHGIETIVIDPENEYKGIVDRVGGTYINIAINSNQFVNPFDLPPQVEDVEYGKGDLLRSQILNLIGLITVLVGGVTPEEEALLDQALQKTYALKGITFDLDVYADKQPPLMQDLMNVLDGMDGGEKLSIRVAKYVTGTFAKLFNNYTNVDLKSGLTVFSIRDLDETLKTPAMFNILNYIWTKVRSVKKKRLLIVDEAWIMLQNDTSANFLYGLIKRARKYGLGVTTISQDVDDFLKSPYGKPIVTNSALQILLKQSTASIKGLEEIFGLSEAEKQKLVSSNIGEGLLFSGSQHVAIKILASPFEKEFISTDVK